MSKGVNKVILIGNLGADPEVRYTASGTAICKFQLATSDQFKDRDGNSQERTEWHRIAAWAKLAEICGKYLTKGSKIYLEGILRTTSWDDKDGNKRFLTEVVARDIQFLDKVQGNSGGDNYTPPPADDDDLPF